MEADFKDSVSSQVNLSVNRELPLTVSLLTSILFGAAILNWPYGFYIFLRIEVFLVLVWAGILLIKHSVPVLPWLTFSLAILFNPIIMIYLTRQEWFYIDIRAAIYVLIIHSVIKHRASGKFI